MDIAVIGTGFIGGVLGRALADAGHEVAFGSRHPDDTEVVGNTSARVTSLREACATRDVVILALPGRAVPELTAQLGDALVGKLVIDATNQMGADAANSRAQLPAGIRYARAFNTLGGENMADPLFPDGRADMFFSAPEADRQRVEEIVEAVGLRPVYVGPDEEALVDCLFRLWVNLAVKQGHGRRLALRVLGGSWEPRPA
ncbi:MAG TPA: NAD(P)-binding domain-containing protein [Acidimicrobiales bacterium]|nr:NAD(P)-binding domain-containing protein [Acidimicrobiales bacterium]